jgi:hypothetical protein
MFGKLGEMFLESGHSYNPQYTVSLYIFNLQYHTVPIGTYSL